MRLWDAAYSTLENRVDENARTTARGDTAILKSMRGLNTRLEVAARADLAQRSRLDALERQDRTHSYAVEALLRRTQTQEASMQDVGSTVAFLRTTLSKLDSDLDMLQQRLAASSSAQGQLGRRVESLSGWADGFRRAGLSADAVHGQLASLSDEVRRIRMRVDSLRPLARRMTARSDR
jgi:chromosome segregation ATPase